jgi:hypothetical protein
MPLASVLEASLHGVDRVLVEIEAPGQQPKQQQPDRASRPKWIRSRCSPRSVTRPFLVEVVRAGPTIGR